VSIGLDGTIADLQEKEHEEHCRIHKVTTAM